MTLKIRIAEEILHRVPELQIGYLYFRHVRIRPSDEELLRKMEKVQQTLQASLKLEDLSQEPPIQIWRKAFKRLGMDPSRYRPSSEALLRRVLQAKPIGSINTAVDVNNYLSLKYLHPCGIYDATRIEGEITFGIGSGPEFYPGLNGRVIEAAGKLVLMDKNGPFGSPFVDSERTRVTTQTTEVLQIIYFHQNERVALPDILDEAVQEFLRIHGGEVVARGIA